MAVLVPTFPVALDTDTELGRYANFAETTVGTGGVDASAATIPITDTSVWPSDGVCLIETEAVAYTGKTGSSITGCTRGFDGTTAAAHAAGVPAYGGIIISAHFESHREAIKAIETLLGIQGQNFDRIAFQRELEADLAVTATTISPFFGSNPGISLEANVHYELEAFCAFLKNLAGTLVWTLTFSAAPTFVNATLETDVPGGAALGAAQTPTAPLRSNLIGGTNAATAFAATGSITTTTYHEHIIRAKFVMPTAQNVRLNVTNSAGTVTPKRGSFIRLRKLVDVGTGVA